MQGSSMKQTMKERQKTDVINAAKGIKRKELRKTARVWVKVRFRVEARVRVGVKRRITISIDVPCSPFSFLAVFGRTLQRQLSNTQLAHWLLKALHVITVYWIEKQKYSETERRSSTRRLTCFSFVGVFSVLTGNYSPAWSKFLLLWEHGRVWTR